MRALLVLVLVGGCARDPEPSELTEVVVWGHGYSLFVGPPDFASFVNDDRWPLFVDEINRIGPDVVFGLGDHTYDSTAEEWRRLVPHLDRIEADVHLLRGNHDTGEIPFHPDLALSRPNKIVDVGRHRFIMLDARQVYADDDLSFIADAVSGHRERAGTFVLTHYASFDDRPLADAPPGVDPRTPQSGYGNWNDDVVPLLRGAVRYVFCGDLYGQLTGHREHDGICYVRSGFCFPGQGPLVFLELELSEDALVAIRPRVVPIDLGSGWYDAENRGG